MKTIFDLIVKDEAAAETKDSYLWYEERKKGLGDDFLLSVQKTLVEIKNNPFSYHKIYKNYRQAIVNRFPFTIVYEIKSQSIIVYAIFHRSRDPKRNSENE